MYNVHVQVNAEKTSEMYCVNIFTYLLIYLFDLKSYIQYDGRIVDVGLSLKNLTVWEISFLRVQNAELRILLNRQTLRDIRWCRVIEWFTKICIGVLNTDSQMFSNDQGLLCSQQKANPDSQWIFKYAFSVFMKADLINMDVTPKLKHSSIIMR